MVRRPPRSTLPYTLFPSPPLFRSQRRGASVGRSHLEHRTEATGEYRMTMSASTSTSVAVPTLAGFEDAAQTLRGIIVRTPQDEPQHLSEVLGVPVHLKLENLQRTGSFKIRGAAYRLSRLTAEERARGRPEERRGGKEGVSTVRYRWRRDTNK